jgi:hypothetical protein
MRKTALIVAILGFIHSANAQFYKSVLPSHSFSDSLNKIVLDYKHNFNRIQNEKISSTGDADIYSSRYCVPGSIECVIYRFHSLEDTTASFQALMYRGENYKEASKIYRNIYRQVNKTRIDSREMSSGFTGKLEDPTEDIRFTSSMLRLGTYDSLYKNFVAEVEMVNNYEGWEVRLNLHYKRNDTEKY